MRKEKKQENEVFEFITLPSADNSKINRSKGIPQYSESELYEDLETKMENLRPTSKKGRRKKIIQLLVLVVLCVMSVLLLAGLGNGDDGSVTIGRLFSDMRVRFFLIALVLVLVYILVESFFISFLCRINTGRFRPILSFKTAMLGKYYDNVTPLGAGGQPFQMVYMNKREVPIGVATSIPLVKYFTWIFVNVPICIVLLIVNNAVLTGLSVEIATTIRIAAWVGLGLNAFVPAFILFFTFLPRAGEKLVGGVLRLGQRMKLVKNYDKIFDKAMRTVTDFKSSMAFVSKRALNVIVCVLLMIADLALFYSVPYFVLLAVTDLAPSWTLWYNIVTLNIFSMFAASFIPTPGNSGVAESSLYLVFSSVQGLSGGLLFWIVLIWRVLTFYLYILLGLFISAYDFVKNSIKEKFINRKRLAKVREKLLPKLVSQSAEERLASATMLRSVDREDRYFAPKPRPADQKLLLRTCYSTTSFTPAEIAYGCYRTGCKLLGIADSYTLSGAKEFSEACDALGVGCLLGVEVSCYISRSRRSGLRINNIYQDGVINLVMTGIPAGQIDRVNQWLFRYRERQKNRVRLMVDVLNDRVEKIGIHVSFEDVLRVSRYEEGGALTERQILVALAEALVERYGRGASLLDALVKKLGIPIPEKTKKHLSDVVGNKDYINDIVSALRGEIMLFYVDAKEDLCSIIEVIHIANEIGAIVLYPYMGDIEQLVFGDLRVQKYEDGFLFELLSELSKLGVRGVTYCRSRHTQEQIARIKEFAGKLNLLEFTGETVFNNRQEFAVEEYGEEADREALENGYAILGSQLEAGRDRNAALFSLETADKFPEWERRVAHFAAVAREHLV